jgi:hypothetical protein
MTKIIYWAAFDLEPTPDLELKPLIQYMSSAQKNYIGDNFVACPAIRNKHTNTFYGVFPSDLEVNFQSEMTTNQPLVVEERTGLYNNSFAFNYRINRIFFSSTSQIMETSPAFLHQTSYSKYGHAPSGAFDIGKWFRPSAPAFQLWSGVKEFKALKGEAHLYFNFPNEDKIELRQFKMTDTLYDISTASLTHKAHIPNQSLKSVYSRFTRSGLANKVMSEIEANLL